MQNQHKPFGLAFINLEEVLGLPALREARVIAGHAGLSRRIRWVHIVDIPEITPWLHGGELLLTTGYSWPREPDVQRKTIRALNDLGLAGILFETGKFLDEIPPAVCREANRLGLPILEAPYQLKFIDVTEAIHRAILERQSAHVGQLEQIHRSLTRAAVAAENLQDLANVLTDLISRPVTIENAEFRLLAHTATSDSSDAARTATVQETRTPERILRILQKKGILEQLRAVREPLRIPPIPEIGMERRVVCPIRTAKDILGYVWILEGDPPISDLDIRATEQTATLAALHILRQQAVASVEERVRYTFVDALIKGELDRSLGLRERAELLGFDTRAAYAVGILTIAPSPDRGRLWPLTSREDFELREHFGRIVRDALQAVWPRPFLTFHLNQVVFLVLAPQGRETVRPIIERLWQTLQRQASRLPLMLTVGDVHEEAAGVMLSHWEADRLAQVVPLDGVYFYHDHRLTQLLYSTDREILRRLRADVMKGWDADDQSRLVGTLLALLRTGFDLGAAARTLGVHRNTVRQRIARIREVYKTPLDDPKFWAQLVLAHEAEQHGLLRA